MKWTGSPSKFFKDGVVRYKPILRRWGISFRFKST
jgi:hypothetical protein